MFITGTKSTFIWVKHRSSIINQKFISSKRNHTPPPHPVITILESPTISRARGVFLLYLLYFYSICPLKKHLTVTSRLHWSITNIYKFLSERNIF